MVVGFTRMLPGVATPPMPLSILAASALLTRPQLSVADCPTVIVVGETLKNSIFGAPEQAAGGGPATTRMLTVSVSPNNMPAGSLNRHKLIKLPGVIGAVIGTLKSAVAPGAVGGTGMGVAAITCPFKRTNS